MDLHHGKVVHVPRVKNPDTIFASDPDLFPTVANGMLDLINDLSKRLRPYLPQGKRRGITEVEYCRIMAVLLREHAEPLEILIANMERLESVIHFPLSMLRGE